jgi:hypothetical protein
MDGLPDPEGGLLRVGPGQQRHVPLRVKTDKSAHRPTMAFDQGRPFISLGPRARFFHLGVVDNDHQVQLAFLSDFRRVPDNTNPLGFQSTAQLPWTSYSVT